jgi:hypothetical protein
MAAGWPKEIGGFMVVYMVVTLTRLGNGDMALV